MGIKTVGCMIGRPFSGKGYVCKHLSEKFAIRVLSMSKILNKSKNQMDTSGSTIGAIMDKGIIVSDNTVVSLLEREIKSLDVDKMIIDGFPRTVEQGRFLETQNEFMVVAFYLKIERRLCVERIENARKLGDRGLRKDDKLETIIKRQDSFERETLPVVKYLEGGGIIPVVTLDGTKTREVNANLIIRHLSNKVLTELS